MKPKRILRAVARRLLAYLDDDVDRDDPQYKGSYIGKCVRLRRARLEGNNCICERSQFFGEVHIGYATTIGIDCVIHGKVSIGRYCQLASHVSLYAIDHPVTHITTYVNRRLLDGSMSTFSLPCEINVGNDVWIGHGSVVLKGVRIHNGAIIGAGSVVTHDVPAYSIAAGNPARIIRKRFDQEIVELLENLAWWNLPPTELARIKPLFLIDFVAERSRAIAMIEETIAQAASYSSSTFQPFVEPQDQVCCGHTGKH